jgi:hypothetical protein
MSQKVTINEISQLMGYAWLEECVDFIEVLESYIQKVSLSEQDQDVMFNFGAALKLCTIFNQNYTISPMDRLELFNNFVEFFKSHDVELNSNLLYEMSELIYGCLPKASSLLERYLKKNISMVEKLSIDTFIVEFMIRDGNSPRGLKYWLLK